MYIMADYFVTKNILEVKVFEDVSPLIQEASNWRRVAGSKTQLTELLRKLRADTSVHKYVHLCTQK